jgi:hypothetical protein
MWTMHHMHGRGENERHAYRQCRSDHASPDDGQDGVELLREVGNAPVESLIDEVLDAQELQGGVEVARLLKPSIRAMSRRFSCDFSN